MIERGLLWLYGLCALGATLNFPAWAALAARRWPDPARVRPWWRDPIFLVRCALTVLSAGVAGLAGVRLYGDLFSTVPLTIPSPVGLFFIGLMASAEPMFLRVDDLHARARGSWSRSWAAYWMLAAGWTVYLTAAA